MMLLVLGLININIYLNRYIYYSNVLSCSKYGHDRYKHPFATGAAILGSTVVIYINNNHYINERVMSCAWKSMRIVSRLQIWYNDMFSKCWECCFFNQHASRFIYVIKEGKTVKAETLLDDHVLRYKKDYDFVIIQYPNSENTNKVVYKRYDEIPTSFTEEDPVKDLLL